MKFLLLLPLLVSLSLGQSSIYNARVNSGIMKEEVTEMAISMLGSALESHPVLADCTDFKIMHQFSRKDEFEITVMCNGTMKWAYFKTEAVTQRDDLAEAPNLDGMGSYENAAMFEEKLYPWFEPLRGDCKVDYANCAYRLIQAIMNFTCPIVCENESSWKLFEFNLLGANPLQSVEDTPTMSGLDNMCLMRMKDLLEESTENSRVIMTDAGFISEFDELEVVDGSFLELSTGVQYCMHVVERHENRTIRTEAVVSLYKFNLDGTEPFMVSLPFETLPYCEYFLKKVSCQWITTGNECVYSL